MPAVVAVHVDFVERAVREPFGIHRIGQENTPHPFRVSVEPQRSALPTVEVAQQINVLRPGKPFAEPPAFERLVPLPSEIAIAVGVIDDRSGRFFYFPKCPQVALVPGGQLFLDRKQPAVPLDHRELFRRISHKLVHYYNKNTKNNSIFVRETKNRKNSNSIAYV